jgi:NADPH-dependent curcumin reductase CurA
MATRANAGPNRQLYMKRFPTGEAGPEDFEVREAPVPEPGDGQVLIEVHYLSVDAALRLIMRDSKDFLFRVQPGDLVRGGVAGKVIQSRHPGFREGEFVTGGLGVQNYAVSDGTGLEKADVSAAPLPAWLGGMGVSGLTAYFAVTEECKPGPGHTMVVNGAAGAVGSIAGQIGRILGARVIGITGSDEKCRWLTEELGFHAAINYRNGDLYEQLVAAAPDRINSIFDNVGGRILDESLRWIALRGVVLLCGSTSQYTEETMAGPANYIWLGTMRARMQGFVVYDYADRFEAARRQLAEWVREGKLTMRENVIDGDVADFPDVFRRLYHGENRGKMVIRLPAARA